MGQASRLSSFLKKQPIYSILAIVKDFRWASVTPLQPAPSIQAIGLNKLNVN